MAKAKKVEVKEAVPSPYAPTDLSLEKRVEMYSKEFDKFKSDMENTFGLRIDMELVFNPRGIVPRMVLVDLLKKENNEQQAKGQ